MRSFVEKLAHRGVRLKLKSLSAQLPPLRAAATTLSDEALRQELSTCTPISKATIARALALVGEAVHRSLGFTAFPVQLEAAAVLFDGVIAQMNTGEGKTLVVAMTAALAALNNKVHVVTPNAYLAQRDEGGMRPLFELLGLTSGVTLPGQTLEEKKRAYAANITYGVHSEFGFDYLRDQQVAYPEQQVQEGHAFVIVDEADLVLIDEARTPLILSGTTQENMGLIGTMCEAISRLNPSDVRVDLKARTAHLAESGYDRLAQVLVQRSIISSEHMLYGTEGLYLMRYVEAALKARFIYVRDRDYVVQNGLIVIIDEATGRALPGRQWQGAVHQALGIKEGLTPEAESVTLAQITYQSYFKLYTRLSGLTGTALAAADEFMTLYGCAVLAIEPNKPNIRKDLPDLLFADTAAKFRAITDDVYVRHSRGQPILIGTSSIAESEALSQWLTWAGLPHQVLNARQNSQEAQIIAEAGMPGAITIATNMAGRGTDIVLGGHRQETVEWQARRDKVLDAGGLHIIGSQPQESSRIDAQLRGRSARQGDPGSSRFYVSLQDPLIQVFGAGHIRALSRLIGSQSSSPYAQKLLHRALSNAQAGIEAQAFAARLELYRSEATVLAKQRGEVYALRNEVLRGHETHVLARNCLTEALGRLYGTLAGENGEITSQGLIEFQGAVEELYHLKIDVTVLPLNEKGELGLDLRLKVLDFCLRAYEDLKRTAERERLCLLTALDQSWVRHLMNLEGLREGAHLKSYAQQNPEHAYAKDAFEAFNQFKHDYEDTCALHLTAVIPTAESSPGGAPMPPISHVKSVAPYISKPSRVSRCSCGSGQYFKHCHGRLPNWPRQSAVNLYNLRLMRDNPGAQASWVPRF